MTEDEAKTKWCFHFTASHTDPRAMQSAYGVEHGLPGPFVHHCIGSACMAWRWRLDEYEAARDAFVDSLNIGGINSREEPRLRGHCGLAGAPR